MLLTASKKNDMNATRQSLDVELLKDLAAEVNTRDPDNKYHALHYCAESGSVKVYEYICQQPKCDPNPLTPAKQTCLHLVAKCDQAKIFASVLQKSPDVNVVDENLRTPLHIACLHGS